MSVQSVYTSVRSELDRVLDPSVDQYTLERIALLVMGLLRAKNASPAAIARAIRILGLSEASPESLERRVRRIENDPEVNAGLCLHPLARAHLSFGKPSSLVLVVDATCQEERVVMLSVSVRYRGSALPLAFAVWPGNQKLEGERFFERVQSLLSVVVDLLPKGVPVTVLADRAFGAPVFTDAVTQQGWHYIVRVQGQTVFRDRTGREQSVQALVQVPGARAKGRGWVFKKRGFRDAAVVVHWGRRHSSPLCLVSDLRPRWELLSVYRKRYAIETMFRNQKTRGWQWEKGQVRDIAHLERLLVVQAIALWLTLCLGAEVARETLLRPPTGRRRSRCFEAKQSLFTLGLQRLDEMLHAATAAPIPWLLDHWGAPNWQQHIHAHHAYAYVFRFQR